MKDHYHTLGLERSASEKQIKAAYRDLCKQCHPDLNRSSEGNERMQEINGAYRVPIAAGASPRIRAPRQPILNMTGGQYTRMYTTASTRTHSHDRQFP